MDTTTKRLQAVEKCREQMKPARCADCGYYGQASCALTRPEPEQAASGRREQTIEERVQKLFARVS